MHVTGEDVAEMLDVAPRSIYDNVLIYQYLRH